MDGDGIDWELEDCLNLRLGGRSGVDFRGIKRKLSEMGERDGLVEAWVLE